MTDTIKFSNAPISIYKSTGMNGQISRRLFIAIEDLNTIPEELFKVPSKRVIGLLIDPHKLNEIRIARLKAMGLGDGANYADLRRINEELDYAKAIMQRIHCTIINVSNRAIEETASMVLEYLRKNFPDANH